MSNKRENMSDLTQLPSGQFADYVWAGLSETMRNALRGVIERGEAQLCWTSSRTVTALERRRLVSSLAGEYVRLTEDGKALIEWMKDNERNT